MSLNKNNFSKEKFNGDKIAQILAFLTFIFIIGFTFSIFIFVKKHTNNLKKQNFYATLFEMADLRKNLAKYYQFFFCLRRLLVAMIFIFLEGKILVQLFCFYILSVLNLLFISSFPYKKKKTNILEIINESSILINIMLVTQIINYEQSDLLGMYINYNLISNIIFNVY